MWWRSTQDKQEVERKLRDYFRSEADSGQPSPQWWDKALSDLGQQRRPPKWRSALAWFVGRPVPALAASIATVVVVAGFSVLLIGRLSTDSRLLPKDSSTASRTGTASPAPEQNAYDNKLEMAAGAIPSTPSLVPPTPSPAPAMLREGWQLSDLPMSPVAGQDMSPVGPYPTPRPGATPRPGTPLPATPMLRPSERDAQLATPTPAPPPPPPMAIPQPAQPPYRFVARSEKPFYAAGEAVMLTVTVINVSDKPSEMRDFPGKVWLDLVDTSSDEGIAVETAIRSERLEPGQTASTQIDIAAGLSATLAPGRYTAYLEIYLVTEGGEVGWSFGTDIVFTVLPPQGAMEKVVAVNEARESGGVKIALQTIEARPAMTTIITLAVPPGYQWPLGWQGPPATVMVGKYRVDEEPWRQVIALPLYTAEGGRAEWTLGPLPADAKVLEFVVTRFEINPGQTVIGPWEWTVPLQPMP